MDAPAVCDVIVRPYGRGDRDGVFRLAADTAFFGETVENYLDDRRLFCDALYRYYTDLEPEHGWVACADDDVVGFLMGCVSTSAQRRLWMKKILPDIALGVLLGRYEIGARTWHHAARLTRVAWHAGPGIDIKKYPAHLHLNVSAAWRRQGLGRRLLDAFLTQMRSLRIPGIHLNTTSLNTGAGKLFESMGFRVTLISPAPQWSGLVPASVFRVTYVLDLK